MAARARPRTSDTPSPLRDRVRQVWDRVGTPVALGLAFMVALMVGGIWGSWKNLCAGDACPSIAQIQTF